MKIIEPSVEIINPLDGDKICIDIERAGRTCYKSEKEFTPETGRKFCRMLIQRGHKSVIEHSLISVKFIVDRGISHELVRHRIASFSQESTRYCCYSKDKFDNQITVINPFFFKGCGNWAAFCNCVECMKYNYWYIHCRNCESVYTLLVDQGAKAEEARSVLPNSLKTEIVMTANVRQWRKVLQLRTAIAAHPQMRQVAVPLLKIFKKEMPALFEDIKIDYETNNGYLIPWATVKVNGEELQLQTIASSEKKVKSLLFQCNINI